MKITKNVIGESLVFSLEGRLDVATSPLLQEQLTSSMISDDKHRHIVLDFAKLSYISSAGLRVLLVGQKAAAAQKKLLTFCNVPDGIRELFEMVGFLNIFSIQEPPLPEVR